MLSTQFDCFPQSLTIFKGLSVNLKLNSNGGIVEWSQKFKVTLSRVLGLNVQRLIVNSEPEYFSYKTFKSVM